MIAQLGARLALARATAQQAAQPELGVLPAECRGDDLLAGFVVLSGRETLVESVQNLTLGEVGSGLDVAPNRPAFVGANTAASAVDPVAGFAWLLFAVFDEELLGALLERLDLLTEGEAHACPLVVTRRERCDAHSVDL